MPSRGVSDRQRAVPIFKRSAASPEREHVHARVGSIVKAKISKLMGFQGLGWDGEGFDEHEITTRRKALMSKGITLGGGTSEIQLNIVAKHVLGLPDQ